MKTRWDAIKELFHAAIARPPDARTLYLDEACAGDARLRAEVESLLRAHAEAGDVLSVFADDSASSRRPIAHNLARVACSGRRLIVDAQVYGSPRWPARYRLRGWPARRRSGDRHGKSCMQ